MAKMNKQVLRHYAIRGAAEAYREHMNAAQQLLRAFPEINGLPKEGQRKTGRRSMTAAQKVAVSKRMKAYWAKWRKQNKA
jgi:hypothetical protein